MIWRLSSDMKRFRKLTTGHHILMGRKTYESLGKPLPNRINVVITRNKLYRPEGVLVFPTIAEALDHCRKNGEEELFVIGGGEIYRTLLPDTDRMYITKVMTSPEGDTFFPEFDNEDWMVTLEEAHLADEKNDHNFIFLDMERRETKNAGQWFPDTEHE